jgi:hypothetical protein
MEKKRKRKHGGMREERFAVVVKKGESEEIERKEVGCDLRDYRSWTSRSDTHKLTLPRLHLSMQQTVTKRKGKTD